MAGKSRHREFRTPSHIKHTIKTNACTLPRTQLPLYTNVWSTYVHLHNPISPAWEMVAPSVTWFLLYRLIRNQDNHTHTHAYRPTLLDNSTLILSSQVTPECESWQLKLTFRCQLPLIFSYFLLLYACICMCLVAYMYSHLCTWTHM